MFEVIVVKNNQKIVYWSNFSPVLVGMFALYKTGQQSKLPTFGRFPSLPILQQPEHYYSLSISRTIALATSSLRKLLEKEIVNQWSDLIKKFAINRTLRLFSTTSFKLKLLKGAGRWNKQGMQIEHSEVYAAVRLHLTHCLSLRMQQTMIPIGKRSRAAAIPAGGQLSSIPPPQQVQLFL